MSDQPSNTLPPCEELANVIDTIYQHLVTETLDDDLASDLWRDLDILRGQCDELPEESAARFGAIRGSSFYGD